MPNDSTDDTPVPPPSSAEVCGRCGYTTRGLNDSRCPECGFDLAVVPYLRVADRDWLRRVVLGINLVRYGSIAALVLLFGRGTVRGLLDSFGVGALVDPRVVTSLSTYLAVISAAVGAFLLSLPDPAFDDPDEARRRRRMRFQIQLGAVLLLILARQALASPALVGATPTWWPLLLAACSVCAVFVTVAVIRGLGDFVRELVQRSEIATEKDLKGTRTSAAWLVPVVIVFVVIGLVSFRRGAAGMAKVVEGGVIGIGLIGTMIALLLLSRATKAIESEYAKASPSAPADDQPAAQRPS